MHCSLANELKSAGWKEFLEDSGDVSVGLVRHLTLSSQSLQDVGVLVSKMIQIELLEFTNIDGLNLIEVSSYTGIEHTYLLFSWHWHILSLLKELSELLTSVQKLLGGSIKIRSELSEGSDLSVLGKIKLHCTRHLLHCLNLGSRSDSRYRKTDINGWSDTLIEELSLQEDLSISDRDDIGWDIGRHITSLGLDDRKSGEGSSAVRLVHLGSSLQQTGVKIEDITWVGLTTWWPSQQEGHLSVSNGLLGEIVIDDQSMLSVVSEVLSNGAAGVWGQELKRSSLGGGSGDDARVVHGSVLLEHSDDVGNSGSLLTDGAVDAVERLGGIVGLEGLLLVDDAINGDGGLSRLPVTNDELTLSSADGHERVDGLQSSHHGLVHGLSWDDTWCLELYSLSLVTLDGAKTIDWVTKGVHDSTEKSLTDWHIDNGSSSLDNISLLNFSIVTQDDDTNVVSLKIEGHTLDS